MSVTINGTNGVLRVFDYQTPITGFSYTLPSGYTGVVFTPAATLATGTVTMPLAPSDGMTVTISSSQIITALTVSANTGQSIINAITTILAGGTASYIYRLSNTTWYKVA